MNFHFVNTLSESKAREEICRVGFSLFQRGYVHATAGNISMRVSNGFLITPTDACLGNLDPASLALLNTNGTQISGNKASKTIALHRQIYSASDHAPGSHPAQCVIHTHSTHCVSLSLNAQGPELLPPITPVERRSSAYFWFLRASGFRVISTRYSVRIRASLSTSLARAISSNVPRVISLGPLLRMNRVKRKTTISAPVMIQTLRFGFGACGLGSGRLLPGLGVGGGCSPLPGLLLLLSLLIEDKGAG